MHIFRVGNLGMSTIFVDRFFHDGSFSSKEFSAAAFFVNKYLIILHLIGQ